MVRTSFHEQGWEDYKNKIGVSRGASLKPLTHLFYFMLDNCSAISLQLLAGLRRGEPLLPSGKKVQETFASHNNKNYHPKKL